MVDTPQPSPSPALSPAPSPAPVAPPVVSALTPASPVGTITPATPSPTPTPSPVAQARPDYVPESFWDATKNEIKGKEFGEHFNALTARVAADDVAKLSRPQKPEEYKVELPADFKPPEGVEFKFRDGDPLLAQARTMAHEMGISQDNFSKLLGLYAGAQVADQQQMTTARNAEIAKLGTTGPARVTAVNTWLDAMGVPGLKGRMWTAADVHAFEGLITKFTSQGGASFRATGREPPEPQGKVSQEVFDKMKPADRLDYARKFPQAQFQTNGARQ